MLLERDARLQPVVVDTVDQDWLLELLEEDVVEDLVAGRRRLRYAVRHCQLNVTDDESEMATVGQGLRGRDGGDCEDHIAGVGTPLIAAGAAEAWGAARRITTQSAVRELGGSWELFLRLPCTHARVESLEVPAWRAQRLAAATMCLTPEAAAWVDEKLAPRMHSAGPVTIDKHVIAALAIFDPEAWAARQKKGKASWRLDFWRDCQGTDWAGTSELRVIGDTADLTAFVALVNRVALALHERGEVDTMNQLRARALGIIGRGEHLALLGDDEVASVDVEDLLDGEADAEPTNPARTSPEATVPEALAPLPTRARQPGSSGQTLRLYVHVTRDDIQAHQDGRTRMGQVERLGPATLDLLRDWLGKESTLVVRPVLDLSRTDAVDQHDPPDWMKELVILRDGHCVFPWCETDARACDQDHIVAYQPHGPPGQTCQVNLACLCRRHHNAKTFLGWRYVRTPRGDYLWTSPGGRHYLRAADGTTGPV